jgi:transcriptional regulator of met regulon
MIIYHEIQHIYGERGEECTQNKLIILLPMKKGRVDCKGRTSRTVRNMR